MCAISSLQTEKLELAVISEIKPKGETETEPKSKTVTG